MSLHGPLGIGKAAFITQSACRCMNTSLYLCLHVSPCARRGMETNSLRDIICYQRERYLFSGFSPHARSISLQPPSRSISFSISHFITVSYLFFSTHLPFHSDTLHALCVTFDKRPSQERSRATSVHLIRFSLITQPLSEHRALVCGYAGCLLGFVCSRLFIYLSGQTELMEKWNGPITASAWANKPICHQLSERWPIPGAQHPFMSHQLLWSVFP